MTFIAKLLIIFAVILSVLTKKKPDVLEDSKYTFERHLGTKTPYRVVANYNTSQIIFEGCTATKLWGLIRHGTRNPNIHTIERMKTRLPDIRDYILDSHMQPSEHLKNLDLHMLRRWVPKLEVGEHTKLTPEGEDEMFELAERFQLRFPTVLDNIYRNTSIKFKYTDTQRAKMSAEYFAAGLFGKKTVRNIDFPDPLKRDPILRFYKLCEKWKHTVKKNPAATAEKGKFEVGTFMKKLIEKVNKKLGYTDGTTELDLGDLYLMYTICGFETAWNKEQKSPWCMPFTLDDFEMFEYAEDLKYYYIDGYGYELTYKQACPAFSDMFHFLRSKNNMKASVYFTHSGTLLKMLAHLGLYKDSHHLTAAEFDKNYNRKWRVSKIDAFGTNLIFVLFDCKGKRKILTLHQERIVRLPSCPNNDLCDIGKVAKYYHDSIDKCKFNELCGIKDEL